MNKQDKRFTEQVFGTMFVLAFLYMGALSAALEGWELTYIICSWSGMAVLITATIACTIKLFKGE